MWQVDTKEDKGGLPYYSTLHTLEERGLGPERLVAVVSEEAGPVSGQSAERHGGQWSPVDHAGRPGGRPPAAPAGRRHQRYDGSRRVLLTDHVLTVRLPETSGRCW